MAILKTRADAAEYLGVSTATLDRLVARGRIGRVVLEREYRYPVHELDAFAEREMSYEGTAPCPSQDEETPEIGLSTSPTGTGDAEGRSAADSIPSGKWRPWKDESERSGKKRKGHGGQLLHIVGAT